MRSLRHFCTAPFTARLHRRTKCSAGNLSSSCPALLCHGQCSTGSPCSGAFWVMTVRNANKKCQDSFNYCQKSYIPFSSCPLSHSKYWQTHLQLYKLDPHRFWNPGGKKSYQISLVMQSNDWLNFYCKSLWFQIMLKFILSSFSTCRSTSCWAGDSFSISFECWYNYCL